MPYFLTPNKHKSKQPAHYTICGKTDGFGAQYQAVMSGIAYCAAKGLEYVHTPFTRLEHTTDVTGLNTFIGVTTPQPPHQQPIIRRQFAAEVHNSPRPSLYYTLDVRKLLKDYYYSTPKPVIDGDVDIAIHIRRGDVRSGERHTSNTVYRRLIDNLHQKYPGRTITIFSEGHPDDFHDLPAELRLNQDIQATFHSLVTANVLVTAKSSFSYAAAILNDNIVYYMDFWHKPLDHWCSAENVVFNKQV